MKHLFWLCLLLYSSLVFAEGLTHVQLIGSTAAYPSLREQLMQVLSSRAVSAKKIYITVGVDALQSTLQKNPDIPIIAIGINRESFTPFENISRVTAIYNEVDPDAQMLLARKIFPLDDLAIIVSDSNTQKFLNAKRHQIQVIRKTGQDSIFQLLARNDKFKAIIGISDADIYHSHNFKSVIMTLYRRNQLLIGWNEATVNSGAIAAFVTTERELLVQLKEVIDVYDKTNKLPQASYAKHASVKINEQVARSMNVVFPNDIKSLKFNK